MNSDRARQVLAAQLARITEEAASLGFEANDDLSTADLADSASDLYQEELDQGRLDARPQLHRLGDEMERELPDMFEVLLLYFSFFYPFLFLPYFPS